MRFRSVERRGRTLGGIVALGIAAALAVGSSLPPVRAAVPPPTVNYQGVLRDQNDVPLTGTYDMVLRFMDAATAGDEILVDQHTAANGNAVPVSGGLFNVALGAGTVADGSGPGTYTSLDAVFRDYGAVWLEIQVGAETLSPRTRFHSSAFSLNASNLAGHPDSYFLDTSSTPQQKDGELVIAGSSQFNPALDVQQVPSSNAVALNVYGDFGGLLADGGNNAFGGSFYGAGGIVAYNRDPGTQAGIFQSGVLAGIPWGSLFPAGRFRENNGNVSVDLATPPQITPVIGIDEEGGDFGGRFQTTKPGSTGVYASAADKGVQGQGGNFGGYFQSSGLHGIYAYGPDHGVDAHAGNYAGWFEATGVDSYGLHASGLHTGVRGFGGVRGGYFQGPGGANSTVGVSTYKIIGTGTPSFVQNHPIDPSKVIVYAAPEGDEAAVYTRGSGRLFNGEARVKLGETFALVANPDIGLTATATPRGEPMPLAVSEIGTGEIVVRGPAGSNAEFDYMVWGLRIGFEKVSIIQPKKEDSKIPSMYEHERFFRDNPELLRYTALARFQGMDEAVRGRKDVDLARAGRLRDAVGVAAYREPSEMASDPQGLAATPAPAERQQHEAGVMAGGSRDTAKPATGLDADVSSRSSGDQGDVIKVARPSPPVLDQFAREGAMEAGDVVSLAPESPGSVRRSNGATDALVIGCVQPVDLGETAVESRQLPPVGPVSVATSHVALCRVDASYGAIAVGDRLILSPTPGLAMRVDPTLAGATILGRAIDPLPSGDGLVRVLLGAR